MLVLEWLKDNTTLAHIWRDFLWWFYSSSTHLGDKWL